MERRLYRSRFDKKIAGVCAGLGDYFDIDPTFVRIIAVLLIFAKGIGLLAYIIAWIIMPEAPFEVETEKAKKPRKKDDRFNMILPGVILVALGALLLLDYHFWWFDFGDYFWALVLIAIGLMLIFRKSGKKELDDNVTAELLDQNGEKGNAV